jgi:T4 RnlA family RNA ligase
MVFDLNILNDYIEKGLVVKNDHPTLPLSIYNYSRTTQYEGKWDSITKSCRGLILDNEGNVVAKSFDKFFNLEEHKPEEIPNEEFEVYEKLDGSLGILFWYQGKWILASKGSFVSDQAIKGKNILNSKYNVEPIPKGYTTLVEIIYPENRIVCNYGDDEVLVVLSMISNASGKELDYDSLLKINEETGLPVVKKYDGVQDYKTLKSLISKDREGYVVRFRNGFRMKIKGEEYVRLHRILTGFSNVDIWEYLKDNKDLNELLDRVPDEFDSWVRNTMNELNSQFETIEKEYQWIFKVVNRVEGVEDRKIFAEYAMKYKHPSILFSMLDGKEYSDIIWKLIRPQYSKPFWQKEDES